MSTDVVANTWEIFELDNAQLLAQRVKIEELLLAGDNAKAPQLTALLDVITCEMRERGVAYEIGRKLTTMSEARNIISLDTEMEGPTNPTTAATDGNGHCENEANPKHASKFDTLMALSPPWYAPTVESEIEVDPHPLSSRYTSQTAPPPLRRGLWDDDDVDQVIEDDMERVIQPKLLRKKIRKGSLSVGRTSKLGVMNKLGFFVVPSKKRKTGCEPGTAIPPPPSRKASVPRGLGVSSSQTAKQSSRESLKPLRSSGSNTLAKRGAAQPASNGTAVRTEAQRISSPHNPRRGKALPPLVQSPVPVKESTLNSDRQSASAPAGDTPPHNVCTDESVELRGQGPRPHSATIVPRTLCFAEPEPPSLSVDTRSLCDEGKNTSDEGTNTALSPPPTVDEGELMTPPSELRTSAGHVGEIGTPPAVRKGTTNTATPTIPVGELAKPTADDKKNTTPAICHGIRLSVTHEVERSYASLVAVSSTDAQMSTPATLDAPREIPRDVESTSVVPRGTVEAARDVVKSELPLRGQASTPLHDCSTPQREEDAAFRVVEAQSATVKQISRLVESTSDAPPPFPALESMMVDPTYFFTFDKQPPDVQRQGLMLLKASLLLWLHPRSTEQRSVSSLSSGSKNRGLPPLSRSGSQLSARSETTSQDDESEVLLDLQADKSRWYFVQTSHEEVYELITGVLDAMDDCQWKEAPPASFFCLKDAVVPPPMWNLWWTWGKPRVQQRSVWLSHLQYVNHIPKSWHLTRKDCLKASIQRYTSHTASSTFAILPQSFSLPKEYVAFAQCFAEHRGLWIMKTVGMSRGRGISLVSDISDVVYDSPVVIQQYVDRPMLVDGGYKFDMRLYVLVTGFQPVLEAFISKLGFARIAAVKYDVKNLKNKFAHLTNTSISCEAKQSSNTVRDEAMRPSRTDTKWTLEKLEQYIDSKRDESWASLWSKIRECVLKALVGVEDLVPAAPCTFELFGFDVLLDSDGRPWVLEVNASPSLEVDSCQDEEVKPQLIDDIVRLIDFPDFDRHALLAAVERRLGGGCGEKGQRNTIMNRHQQKHGEPGRWAKECSDILRGWKPRRVGVDAVPDDRLGNFEQLAPSPLADSLRKQKRSGT